MPVEIIRMIEVNPEGEDVHADLHERTFSWSRTFADLRELDADVPLLVGEREASPRGFYGRKADRLMDRENAGVPRIYAAFT